MNIKEQFDQRLKDQSQAPTVAVAKKDIDGRSLKRTKRSEQFSTCVSPSFKSNLHKVAMLTGKNYNLIIEESLNLYISHMSNTRDVD